MPRTFYVYILANRSRTIYVGVTSDIYRRVLAHRSRASLFTRKYMLRDLVHVEVLPRARDAIEREKQIKRWTLAKKLALIERDNPSWRDLAADWFSDGAPSGR